MIAIDTDNQAFLGLVALRPALCYIEAWAKQQPDNPSLSEAIRRLLDMGSPPRRSRTMVRRSAGVIFMAQFFFSLAMATGFASVLMSAGILAWQTFQWLQFAEWPDVPVYYAFDFFEIHYPVARWLGIEKMIATFLQWPLSVIIFGLGLLLAWLFAAIGSEAEREEEMRSKARR